MTIHLRRGALIVVSAALVVLSSAQADNRNLKIAKKPESAAADKRVALVIGNAGYASSPLRNPVNDARAVSAALKDLGFDVIHQENLGLKAMGKTIREFGNKLKESGGVGLFYYAGHGMQVKGRNYLIPVDADIQNEDEIAFNALDANIVLEKMDTANNRLNLVILDACRNNPFARSFRSGSQGLAQMDAPGGTLIAFATAPGSVAADGEGSNGIYTKHLIANMKTPGLAVEQLFKKVRIGVMSDTKERQVPWESSSLKGDFYFKAAPVSEPVQVAAVKPSAPAAAEPSAATIELAFWESIKTSRALADFQAYLEQYPKGRFAALARNRVKQIEQEEKDRPAAAEFAFWDSIKTSRSVDDFKAYLEQYPNGKFTAIARNRVKELKAQAASVASTAPPASAAPATAAAAQAPQSATTAVAAASGATTKLPTVGDAWTYQYIDGWKNAVMKTLVYEVTAVSPKEIRETAKVDGRSFAGMTYRDEAMALGVKYGDLTKTEFAPYLAAFAKLEEGERWNDIEFTSTRSYDHPNPWRLKGRVVGRETVKVPAGTFKAVKVEVTGTRAQSLNSRFAPSVIQHMLWYAPEIKRVVRQETNSATPSAQFQGERDIFELVSFKPGTGASSASGGPVRVASTAPLSAAIAAKAPKPGDSWTYRYTDGWNIAPSRTLMHTVLSVSDREIVESLNVDGEPVDERPFAAKAMVVERDLAPLVKAEFSPYLTTYIPLDEDTRWDSIDFEKAPSGSPGSPWRLKGKVVGREKVKVPAGTFDAYKIEITGNRAVSAGVVAMQREAASVLHTVWFAPAVKRTVKQTTVSRTLRNDFVERDTYELVSYKLQ